MEKGKKLTRSEQARINGAKSKGPKTEEGRGRCAQAKISHGAYAARISTLPHEDQTLYAAMWEAAVAQLAPRNALELTLVAQYMDWNWRASRFLEAANAESLNRAAGYVEASAGDMSWPVAHVKALTEHNTVQSLQREASRCTYNANRVLKQLKDLREFAVPAESSQEMAVLKEEILVEGVKNNPVNPWERLDLPDPPPVDSDSPPKLERRC